jgi:hypothetical protein
MDPSHKDIKVFMKRSDIESKKVKDLAKAMEKFKK